MNVTGAWCAFGLGSNLGNREQLLRQAIDALRELPGLAFLGHASFYETAPVDCPPNSPCFLNTAAHGRYTGDVNRLLRETQSIERQVGRRRSGQRNEARPIDIDLLLIDGVALQTEALTLPHPRLCERLFVLEPLAEIAPHRVLANGHSVLIAMERLRLSPPAIESS